MNNRIPNGQDMRLQRKKSIFFLVLPQRASLISMLRPVKLLDMTDTTTWVNSVSRPLAIVNCRSGYKPDALLNLMGGRLKISPTNTYARGLVNPSWQ